MTTLHAAAKGTVPLDARVVAIDTLEPNDWNVNAMNDDEYRAARESIRETGFVDPITVRAHPKKKTQWQITLPCGHVVGESTIHTWTGFNGVIRWLCEHTPPGSSTARDGSSGPSSTASTGSRSRKAIRPAKRSAAGSLSNGDSAVSPGPTQRLAIIGNGASIGGATSRDSSLPACPICASKDNEPGHSWRTWRVAGRPDVVGPRTKSPTSNATMRFQTRTSPDVSSVPPPASDGNALICEYAPVFEIIDGEQRWKAARDEGWGKVSITVLVLSDVAARKLTLQLNNKGTPDKLGLAREIAYFQQMLGDRAGVGLPWSATELAELGALAKATMPDYGDGTGAAPAGTEFVTLTFHVPADAAPVIEQAIRKAVDAGESDDRGVALERICADFNAGAD